MEPKDNFATTDTGWDHETVMELFECLRGNFAVTREAIMHGMTITKEVADLRNRTVKVLAKFEPATPSGEE